MGFRYHTRSYYYEDITYNPKNDLIINNISSFTFKIPVKKVNI